MKGNEFVSSLNVILTWITRLVYVNILWIFFSFLGLIIGGIFPATVATLCVFRKWLMGEQNISIWNTFNQKYRKEFLGSNTLGWILTVIGIILYLNYSIMNNSERDIFVFIPFAFYILLFFYITLIIWSFPLLSHYKGSNKQHLKNAIIIGFAKIHYTIVIMLILVTVVYFSLEYPGITPFFPVSLGALGWTWITLKTFNEMDKNPSSKVLDISRIKSRRSYFKQTN